MKLILWFLCSLLVVRCQEKEHIDKLLEAFSTRDDESPQLITDTAECIRQHLTDGIPSLNIPSFNPLQISTIKPDFSNLSYIEGNLLLTDLYLDGIPKFYLTDVDYSLASILPPRVRMEFVVNVDEIVLEVTYDGAVTLFNFLELFGTGEIKLTIKNVQIPVSVLQGLLNVQDASMTLAVDDVQMSTTGLLRDERLSGLIGNRVEDILQTILSQYSETINETLTSTLLSSLEGNTALDLLRQIQSIRDSCNEDEAEEEL